MTIKVGINGFGRIGRFVFRAAQERNDIEVVGTILDKSGTTRGSGFNHESTIYGWNSGSSSSLKKNVWGQTRLGGTARC